MNESNSRSRNSSQNRNGHGNRDETIQYLLSGEEQLLQSIFARAPLPGVLIGICNALDFQIGNIVSHITLQEDDAIALESIAVAAEVFGLHMFFSAGVAGESGEELATLEMYCRVLRNPSFEELQLIGRASCLAAIAVKLNNEADQKGNCDMRENRSVRRHVPE